ncbi:CRM-domain containing factor CFM3, chloroplastic/mitochondrial-like isoform X2 [Cicer arietinum]|uniref:CRM-domain containing factor CFM3, chloroplastic/mitochondrial-like isoform X2 n=1 Tax=Cicer arietinum TaxID=3827 RepID=A0A3Q7YH06_CICAR|nr:CRM-domain containing factor CFM3, chloroplastic/mitochondrial-like isoform X2 [Cicer arietinum]
MMVLSSLNSLSFPSKFKFTFGILNRFYFSTKSNFNAIDRVVFRFRNLASLDDDDDDDEPTRTLLPRQFLHREWIRTDEAVFPSEKEVYQQQDKKKNEVIAPCLAEEELKRLRTIGIHLKKEKKVSVPQAGLTRSVLQKIHHQWKNNELVCLKFHQHLLAPNINLAHRIVQHRTGGLVIWRSGSVMWVYRGNNYQGPKIVCQRISKGGPENMTPEEVEFDRMLDDFGPRFVDWWGTGVLPVDADLLPSMLPGYKTPLRLLPARMHPRLTNDEHTNMLKLAKALPCHFALGRNRNLQGLACAILKLWEKSLVAKIAVKRGVQNTNNELMAQELKKLTGGTLLLRNKYYIVIYRGKDFIPASVGTILAERHELKKQMQDVREKVERRSVNATPSEEDRTSALAGSLTESEFYEAQAPCGRDLYTVEHEKMMKEAAKTKNVRLMKKVELKLAVAQADMLKAEKLLAELKVSMVPAGPDNERETITDKERVMFRAVGLKMKAYLQLGTHGIFDGIIENMHLHWKHRELVKLITKEKTLAIVENTARLLDFKSGGILVAIDRLPKGFSLIYYRGKNYRRPISLRPRNHLMKAKALEHSISMQRHEALSQHITELRGEIEEMKKELGLSQDLEPEDRLCVKDPNQIDRISEFTQGTEEKG